MSEKERGTLRGKQIERDIEKKSETETERVRKRERDADR